MVLRTGWQLVGVQLAGNCMHCSIVCAVLYSNASLPKKESCHQRRTHFVNSMAHHSEPWLVVDSWHAGRRETSCQIPESEKGVSPLCKFTYFGLLIFPSH